MRQIDDVEQAENDRQAKRDERNYQAPDQTVERKSDDEIHVTAAYPLCRRPLFLPPADSC